MNHLRRHGCAATLHHKPKASAKIADTILNTALETGAEMVVMGAYEHAKFAEDLFGGVTHSILANAKIPLLLAH